MFVARLQIVDFNFSFCHFVKICQWSNSGPWCKIYKVNFFNEKKRKWENNPKSAILSLQKQMRHPSIVYILLCFWGCGRSWCLTPAVTGWEAWYILDRSPQHTHLHQRAIQRNQLSLSYWPVGSWSILRELMHVQAEHANFMGKQHRQEFEPKTFLLQGNSITIQLLVRHPEKQYYFVAYWQQKYKVPDIRGLWYITATHWQLLGVPSSTRVIKLLKLVFIKKTKRTIIFISIHFSLKFCCDVDICHSIKMKIQLWIWCSKWESWGFSPTFKWTLISNNPITFSTHICTVL